MQAASMEFALKDLNLPYGSGGSEVSGSTQVRIYIIRNPFQPETREVRRIEHSGQPVSHYIKDVVWLRGTKLVVAINGYITSLDAVPKPGDFVVVTAEIEASVVAGAVATFATGAASLSAATGLTAIAYAAVYGATYLATTFAIGWGISQLVDALGLGPDMPDSGSVGDRASSSPTYGWGPLQQTETEGNPIPIIFGEHKVAGQVINKFKTLGSDKKEYYNALLVVNDGLVDSISDIRVNDQPVHNYRGIETYTRLGSLNDNTIPGFNQIVQQRSPGVRLTTNYHTIETDGNAVEAIGLIFTASRGLYYSNDNGGLDERSAKLDIEYREVGESNWTSYKTVKISGASTEAIRKSVLLDDLSPGQYEVSVSRVGAESTDFREQDGVWWSGFKEIIYDDLIYPGLAKYAIKALATDQLSNQEPRLSCVVKRETVSVYNPNTEEWESRSAYNPAWATYSLLNTYHGINESRILYDEFKDWADYCAEEVEGEQRFRLNIVLDNLSNAWDNAQRIASMARAKVVRRGSKYGVFVDKPEDDVTHLFTMGNIIDESFNLQYLPMKDRANAIEITYIDPDRDYSNQVVGVYSDDYKSSDSIDKKTSIKLNAAMPRSQAIREGAFRLNSTKYLVRTIEFEAAIDSFPCVLGDLVYFQHIIPHYDDAYGGRIVDAGNDDGDGNPYVQLDQELELESGKSYAIMVRLSDDSLIEKTLQSISETHTTDTLLLSSDWSTVPEQYDLYVFGPADTYKKKYRIINTTRSQELTRKITCLEYVSEIYDDTSYVIENPSWESVTQEAIRVRLREFLTYSKGGDYQSNISVSWDAAHEDVGSNWDVWLVDETLNETWNDDDFEEDTFEPTENEPGVWHVGRTADTSFVIGPNHLTQNHTYTVFACPAGEGLRNTEDNWSRIRIKGKLAPPNDVTGFSGSWNSIKRTVNFSWDKVDNLDLSHYEIRQGTSWDDADVVVKEAKKESTSIPIEEGVTETRTYLIKAVDTSDIYSVNYDSVDVAIDTKETPLSTPTGLSLSTSSGVASDGTDRVTIVADWDANAEADPEFDHYVLRMENLETEKLSQFATEDNSYQWEVLPNTEYGVAIKAVDVSGNFTEFSSEVEITSAKDSTPPSDPTNLSLTGFTGFIRLKWDHGAERDLSHFDIYRNTSDDFSSASKIDTTVRDFVGTWAVAKDDPGDYETYYYWVVADDTSGNESDAAGPVSGSKSQIEETNISDDSISTPKLRANAVVADKIEAGAVTANKIDVSDLSAISADIGTVTAGVIESSNWGSSDGTKIDLDDEIIKIGGDDDPQLEWDGNKLTIKGEIVAGLIESTNWSNSDGMQIDLDNEKFRIGGSDDPDFEWDNGTLTIQGSTLGGTLKTSSVRIESGDGKTYFDGNTMYVYDSDDNLRVKLGEL